MMGLGLADVALIAWYIGVLVLLEGLLSADNALVLAVMVRHLPKNQQRRVLFWGIWGAVGFRVLALSLSSVLLSFWFCKVIGGGYLLYLALSHFFHRKARSADARRRSDVETDRVAPRFLGDRDLDHRWPTSPFRSIRFSPRWRWPRAFPPISGEAASSSSSFIGGSARHHHDAIRRALFPDSPRAISRTRRGCLLPGSLDWTEARDQWILRSQRRTASAFTSPNGSSGWSCS